MTLFCKWLCFQQIKNVSLSRGNIHIFWGIRILEIEYIDFHIFIIYV